MIIRRLITAIFGVAFAIAVAPGFAQETLVEKVAGEKQQKRIEDLLPGVLKKMEGRVRPQHQRMIAPRVDELMTFFQLEDEKVDALKKESETAIKQSVQIYVDRCKKRLGEMSLDDQEKTLKRGYISVSHEPRLSPLGQPAWAKGISELLTKEQQALWDRWQKENEARRLRSMAGQMVVLLDRNIGLSATQREALIPVLEKTFRAKLKNYLKRTTYGLGSSALYNAFRGEAEAGAVGDVLDEEQAARWKTWMKSRSLGRRSIPVSPTKKGVVTTSDDVFREDAIADTLHLMKVREAKIRLDLEMAKVEDVVRVAGLDSEQQGELALAVKGGVEADLLRYLPSVEAQVRRNAKEVARNDLYKRLSQSTTMRFTVSNRTSPIWTSTIDRVLNSEQKERWEKAVAERSAFEMEVAKKQVQVQLESLLALRPEQMKVLGPLLDEEVETCGEDFERYMRSTDPWFFQNAKLFFPFAKIPEEQTKELVTARQWGKWGTTYRRSSERYIEYLENAKKPAQNAPAAVNPEGGQMPAIIPPVRIRINGGGQILAPQDIDILLEGVIIE